jgi:hypothetical protein
MEWARGERIGKGEITVYDTATWRVLHQEPVDGPAFLLGGNPISLSGDGRWLIVAHHPQPDGGSRPLSVLDTLTMTILSSDSVPRALSECTSPWAAPLLVGRPGHSRIYAVCRDTVVAFDSRTLLNLWKADAYAAPHPGLMLSPDGTYLYGLYPQVDLRCCRGSSVYVEQTDLFLKAWYTETGELASEVNLRELVEVPDATIGRGDGTYLAISPDGKRLYALWEDRLWDIPAAALTTASLDEAAIRQAPLPAPADGMASSVDGRELYILPSTAGSGYLRGRGMWTVDGGRMWIVRQTGDWPDLPPMALLYSAPRTRPK